MPNPNRTTSEPKPRAPVLADRPAHSGAGDAQIIQAVLRGDTNRYAELVSRYQRATWKLAYSLVGNFEDAREISQNSFVKAYRSLRRFRGAARFSTWLYRIVVNECTDFLRKKVRQPRLIPIGQSDREEAEGGIFEVADPGGTPQTAAADRELARRLSAAIDQLPTKQRTAFALHHLHGMPLEEVAQAMGCRVGTVKAHLFRAGNFLRAKLEPFV